MDPERARELLRAERQRLEEALRVHRPELSDELSRADSADLGSDVLIEELDEGLSDDWREELAAVERAEQRLADGTYGISIESGEPIPDERLEAVPTAERTAEEQARYEGEA
jgi:RNA polymerase-binding transcription factor